jgi:hypothetical protein
VLVQHAFEELLAKNVTVWVSVALVVQAVELGKKALREGKKLFAL